MTDGAIIHVAKDAAVEGPIVLRFVTQGATPVSVAARVLIVVEEGAAVTVVESHEGQGALQHQLNTATEIVAGDGARVQHVRLAWSATARSRCPP